MVNLTIRCHPDVLFGYSNNHVELILRVENHEKHPVWVEAEISVPQHLSLSPHNGLRKGRVRIGIVSNKEFLEKAVRVYGSSLTHSQMYKCNVILYSFNQDGVIEKRLEKTASIRCELKKEASI
ncbi:MAG: hypothetical protein ABH842_06320 [Candidatus Micrarchaeota archaeon]